MVQLIPAIYIYEVYTEWKLLYVQWNLNDQSILAPVT